MAQPHLPSGLPRQIKADWEAVIRTLATRRIHPLLSMDLTIPQVRILVLVGSGTAITGGQLALHLGVKPPTISAAMDRLVEHGLVARTDSDPDRRVKHLDLTAEGRALYDDLVGVQHTSDDIFGELSSEDLAALAQGIHALREALERRN